MSATYNWKYRSGSKIDRGLGIVNDSLSINPSADDVKSSNTAYVALYGNDVSGNGSRLYPWRTIAYTMQQSHQSDVIVIGSGTYREKPGSLATTGYMTLVGDGDVIIDGTGYDTFWTNQPNYVNGLTFRNFQYMAGMGGIVNSTFMDMSSNDFNASPVYNSTFIRIGGYEAAGPLYFPRIHSPGIFYNNTFIDCMDMMYLGDAVKFAIWNNIFIRCNIIFTATSTMTYSLFYNCNFRFNTGRQQPTGLYPTVPTGYQQLNTIEDLRAAHEAFFPNPLVNFDYCAVTDPKFNNEIIGDYTLAFDSPAKNMNYFGSYIGAYSIGTPIKASATGATGFDSTSNINLAIAEDSITLIDVNQNGQIDSVVIPNLVQREISKFPSYGFNADRNGEYIDSIADLDSVTISAGQTLSIPASYLVEVASIEYNGHPYQPGERFTSVTGQTTFTTSSVGVVREIMEAPQRHTIMARFSNGNSVPMSSANTLTSGHWYYVSVGPVTYHTGFYNAGGMFKAVANDNFSGSGTVTLAMADETFQHYEPGIKPTSNNAGDVRTGAIVRGNGDPANYVAVIIYEDGASNNVISGGTNTIKFGMQSNNNFVYNSNANDFGAQSQNNVLISASANVLSHEVQNVRLESSTYNIFEPGANTATLLNSYENVIGAGSSNTNLSGSSYNTIGQGAQSTTIVNSNGNNIGEMSQFISLLDQSYYNKFANGSMYITAGSGFTANNVISASGVTFGNDCTNNFIINESGTTYGNNVTLKYPWAGTTKTQTFHSNPINYNEVAFLMETAGVVNNIVMAGASSPQIKTGQDATYSGLAPVYPYAFNGGDRLFITFTYDNLGQPNANVDLFVTFN